MKLKQETRLLDTNSEHISNTETKENIDVTLTPIYNI